MLKFRMEGGSRRSPPPRDRGGGLCVGSEGDGNLGDGCLEGARGGLGKLSGRRALDFLSKGREDGERGKNNIGGESLEISMEESNNFAGEDDTGRSLNFGGGETMHRVMAAVQGMENGRSGAGEDAKLCGMEVDHDLKGGKLHGEGAATAIPSAGEASHEGRRLAGCGDGRMTAGTGEGGRNLMAETVMEGVTASLIPGSPHGKGINALPGYNPSNYSNLESNYDLYNLPIKFNAGRKLPSNNSTNLATVTPRFLNYERELGAAGMNGAGDVAGSDGAADLEGINRAECIMADADMAGDGGEAYVACGDSREEAERAADVAINVGEASTAEVEISTPMGMNSTVEKADPVVTSKTNINKQPPNAWKNKVQKLINVGAVKDFSRDESTVIMDHAKSQSNA